MLKDRKGVVVAAQAPMVNILLVTSTLTCGPPACAMRSMSSGLSSEGPYNGLMHTEHSLLSTKISSLFVGIGNLQYDGILRLMDSKLCIE